MKRIAIALCLLLAGAVAIVYAMQPMAVVGGGVSCTTLDTFAGTNGTDLEAHDTTWVRLTGDVAEIQSSQATIESAGAVYPVYHWNQVAQSADGRVCATATDLGVGTNSYACVNIRLTTNVVSTRGGYSFCAFADNSQLFEFTQAGSFDILDTDLTAVADGSEICIKAQGNTVSGTVDGTTVVSDPIADNNNPVTVAGYIGLELGSDSDGTDIRVDDFKVCDTTVATVSPLFAGDLSQFIQPTHGLRATNATNSLYPWAWRGLVAAYAPGLGNTGGTLRDVSGFRRDGTFNNVSWVSSRHGWALNFNGTNSYASIGTLGSLGPNLAKTTVIIWLRTTDTTTQWLFGTLVTGLTRFSGRINTSSDGTQNQAGHFQVNFNDENNLRFTYGVDVNTGITDGEWHHVAIVSRSIAHVGIIYIDGIAQPITNFEADLTGPFIDFTHPMLIGDVNLDGTPQGTLAYDGDMSDVRFYGRNFSASEVYRDYQNFRRRQTYLALR